MKILKNWIKTHEQKSKLDLINELLISGSVEENIELFNKVKSKFHYEMDLERNRKEKEINLINRIRPIKECDPKFDIPLSKLNVEYEIVKPN
jgi:gamma-glutamyl-gamma-aminobutyrate hydrolase PuuD